MMRFWQQSIVCAVWGFLTVISWRLATGNVPPTLVVIVLGLLGGVFVSWLDWQHRRAARRLEARRPR